MAAKRSFHRDPEYEAIPAEIQEKRMTLIENDVRKQTKRKIENIIRTTFEQEIAKKDTEIDAIDDLLHEGRCMLDRLRACVITKYYATLGQEHPYNETTPSIHPTVKTHLGKSPKHRANSVAEETPRWQNELLSIASTSRGTASSSSTPLKQNTPVTNWNGYLGNNQPSTSKMESQGLRLPRYKSKCKIVIGNVSKFIPVWHRGDNDQSTHKWMVYVRGDRSNPNIDSFVKKVRFLLHPSYRPNDIVEINQPPFHLIKRGWGEFPVRVQLHFHDPRNKPVDVIHHLKLDKTFTGLQTLGAETVAELQLYKPEAVMSPPFTDPFENEFNSLLSNNSLIFDKDNLNSSLQNEPIKMELDEPSEVILNDHSKDDTPTNSSIAQIQNHLTVTIASDQEKSKMVTASISPNSVSVAAKVTTNGVNTTFVKCIDSEGNVLLVPQSSLRIIKSEDKMIESSPSTPQKDVVTKNNSINNLNQTKPLNENNSMPSYILRVVPNKETGQNQVLLIPMAEKQLPSTENNVLKVNQVKRDFDGVTKKVVSKIQKKSVLQWEQEIEEINLDYLTLFPDLLKRVCRIFPLVKEGIARNIFPYCATSLEEYLRWNAGKQRASEWLRAGEVRNTILNLLKKRPSQHIKVEDVWSRRMIMVWCRKNGLTPMPKERNTLMPEPTWSGVELCSLTNASDITSTLQKESPIQVSGDEEIDVVDLSEPASAVPTHSQVRHPAYCNIPYLSPAAEHIKEVAAQIGVNIKPVELEPSICVPVVEEIILSAVQQLACDLIGSSLNEGFTRMGGKISPEEVTVSDVYSAVKTCPQFDFLTNSSLGIPKGMQGDT